MLRQLLGFSAFAAAALLGLGDCIVYDEVSSVTPLPGETGVAVDEIPTVSTTTTLDLDRAVVSLVRASDEAPIGGRVITVRDEEGYHLLRFVPEPSLEVDTDYLFTVTDALRGYAYADPITNTATTFGVTAPDSLEIAFTTASEPRVRHTERYNGHAHIYLSFSQEMNPNTFTADTVHLLLDGAAEQPYAIEYDGGPAHMLDISARRVDFADASVAFDGAEAADGTVMQPVTVEIAPPR